MQKKINRRAFLKTALLISGGSVALLIRDLITEPTIIPPVKGSAISTYSAYIPVAVKAQNTPIPSTTPPAPTPTLPKTPIPPSSRPRVVYAHSDNATSFTGGYFYDHVNQGTINSMVDQGVMTLTGATTLEDAWRSIIPGYTVGQKIAIKVSFNNSQSCNAQSNVIDAVVEPVLAVIRGLLGIGVSQSDIHIYDSFRFIPSRFTTPLHATYANVKIFDAGSCNQAGLASNQNFTFTPPSGPGIIPHPVNQILVNAAHLINIPIMKRHGSAGYSLAMKNHFGSTTLQPSRLHEYSTWNENANFSKQYSPMIDLNKNMNVRTKTRLILGDALFCAPDQTWEPRVWHSFGNKFPNSLLFSRDPVAIDCVMADFILTEVNDPQGVIPWIDDSLAGSFLPLAEQAGLGISERANPWTNTYKRIELIKI